ncbi:MAG: hypothetical protein K8S99_09015 [Planctomycetes bacterium]|nr:hypothetical protein [Planctomycetota bacterium]
MIRKALSVVVLTVIGLAAVGCQKAVYLSDDNQVLSPQSGRGLVERPNSPIPDAPMPVGFVVVESKSRSHSTSAGRVVEHYYQGLASKGDTLNFYRTHLTGNGWQRRSETNVGGIIAATFAKGRETLELRITNPRDVTTVRLNIRPLVNP